VAVTYGWTDIPDDLGQGRDTGDPLGFRAAAVRVARRLVPALTQNSFRARGFGLLCFGLDTARRNPLLANPDLDRAFLRFERLVVYAQCYHHRDEGKLPDSARYAGTRRAFARIRSTSDLDLNLSLLLHDDLSGGLWGAYRRPAVHLGLLRPLGSRTNPTATGLSALGSELANTLEPSAIANAYAVRKLARNPNRRTTPAGAAVLIPADAGQATAKEAAALSRAFTAYDSERANLGRGRPFASLRASYDAAGGELTLNGLEPSRLTEGQAQALADAVALDALMTLVEAPYRRWVVGGKGSVPKTVAEHRAWARVRTSGEPDLVALHDDLKVDPSLGAVHAHQERIATSRGREPWVQGDPFPGRDKLVRFDFTLGSAAGLFNDGVRPGHAS
jgi:hypothetical protein